MAARPGDRVVITNVIIKESAIVLEINGGPKKKEKWYQHVQVGTRWHNDHRGRCAEEPGGERLRGDA